MRRLPLLAPATILLALAGCSGRPSIEEAREASVITVNGVSLDGATLERVLMATPDIAGGPSMQSAALVITAFVDGVALRQAILRGDSLTDSLAIRDAVLPDAIRGGILTFLQERAAAAPAPTDAQADSLARLGGVRVFQHILFRMPQDRDSVSLDALARRASAIQSEAATTGADFAAIARRVSEDTSTARDGGLLPAMQRQNLPPGRLADAAWRLAPGDVSVLLPSDAGIHIMRRVTTPEAREPLRRWLAPVLARQADSMWVDSLALARQLAISEDAPARLREMSREPFTGGGAEPFAVWQGGELTADETRMWVSVLPLAERAGMAEAPDSALTLLVEQFSERDLVAEAAGIRDPITPQAWEALVPQYRAAVSAVIEQNRDILSRADSNAALRDYLVAISTGERPYRPLPSGLGGTLRRSLAVEHDIPALETIITHAARAWALARGDSTAVDSAP
jgi:hypothetical protein